ncbi:hypothetical protein [Microvirga brassicacearum]|uniref:Uncharacterized protein n=1 Tax=Microvirga brassicacearum TaxID=2580413 RepID=A0A5N3PBX5_9HYPH|nr:hypothetical protein [Microvirga brassicacearum]KAB0267266.1 hypothetical protein FEZ63_08030 [Microvirga brassicacearum]
MQTAAPADRTLDGHVMANAAEAHAMGTEGKDQNRFGNECFEWLAPLLRRDFVHGTIQQLAEVPADRVAEIPGFSRRIRSRSMGYREKATSHH